MSIRGKVWVLLISGVIALYAVVGGSSFVGKLLTTRAQQTVNDPNAQMKIVESVLDHIQNDYVDVPDMDKVRLGALRGLANGLDPYSSYLTPEQAKEFQANKGLGKTGIGVEFAQVSGWLYVLGLTKGGPADRAGMKRGDVIEYVESKATRDISLYDAKQLVAGEPGTTVSLRVLRSGEKPQTIKVVRGEAKSPAADVSTQAGKVGVIKVYGLGDGSAADIRGKITELSRQGVQKIVLDLRGVAGGKLDEGAALANLFIKSGTLATVVGKDSKVIKTFAADPGKTIFDGTVALLSDFNTADAAEVVVSAFIDHKRGEVVGERTFGAGVDTAFYPLSSGGGFLLTVAKWASPAGIPFLGDERAAMGLKPTVEVKRPDAQGSDSVDNLIDQNDPNGQTPQATPTPQNKPKPQGQPEDVQLKKALELVTAATAATAARAGGE